LACTSKQRRLWLTSWQISGAVDTVIFDTDVLIYAQRGSLKAARAIDGATDRKLSVQSVMELLQGARNKADLRVIKQFLSEMSFTALPLTESIGHRALVYVEEYGLSSNVRCGDATIAATAVENAQPLITANVKHFKAIKELELVTFRP